LDRYLRRPQFFHGITHPSIETLNRYYVPPDTDGVPGIDVRPMPRDAVPDNGKAVFDYLPDRGKSFRDLAIADGDGWKIPPPPARFFAVNPLDADWVDRQCTMHPLSTLEEPARITGACDDLPAIGYILARSFDGPFKQFYAQAGERRWWQAGLACGHDVMFDMPNELTDLLLQREAVVQFTFGT
jgi:hypothetical protein